jgi:hypothetical protein
LPNPDEPELNRLGSSALGVRISESSPHLGKVSAHSGFPPRVCKKWGKTCPKIFCAENDGI